MKNNILIICFTLLSLIFITSCLVKKPILYSFNNDIVQKVDSMIVFYQNSGYPNSYITITHSQQNTFLLVVSFYSKKTTHNKLLYLIENTSRYYLFKNTKVPVIFDIDNFKYSQEKWYVPIGGGYVEISIGGEYIKEGKLY